MFVDAFKQKLFREFLESLINNLQRARIFDLLVFSSANNYIRLILQSA